MTMELDLSAPQYDANGRILPDRHWVNLSDEHLAALDEELTARGIDWLPLPETDRKKLLSRNRHVLELPDLTGFVTDVLSVPADGTFRRVALPHFQADGYVRPEIVYISTLRDELAERRLGLYDLSTGELMRPEPDMSSRAIRSAMLYPSVLNGTVVRPDLIESIIKSFLRTKNPHAATCATGMAMRRLGFSAERYLRVRYANALLKDFADNRFAYQRHGAIPDVYKELWARFSRSNYDNWRSERLVVSKDQPFGEPDPQAYNVLTKINNPDFEREPENPDRRTFDRVRIYFGLKTKSSFPHRKDYILKYRRDYVRIALAKITSMARFKNAGVPVQFLRPVSMTITACDELELLFELKIK